VLVVALVIAALLPEVELRQQSGLQARRAEAGPPVTAGAVPVAVAAEAMPEGEFGGSLPRPASRH
jgi:hypothetical protein